MSMQNTGNAESELVELWRGLIGGWLFMYDKSVVAIFLTEYRISAI